MQFILYQIKNFKYGKPRRDGYTKHVVCLYNKKVKK